MAPKQVEPVRRLTGFHDKQSSDSDAGPDVTLRGPHQGTDGAAIHDGNPCRLQAVPHCSTAPHAPRLQYACTAVLSGCFQPMPLARTHEAALVITVPQQSSARLAGGPKLLPAGCPQPDAAEQCAALDSPQRILPYSQFLICWRRRRRRRRGRPCAAGGDPPGDGGTALALLRRSAPVRHMRSTCNALVSARGQH